MSVSQPEKKYMMQLFPRAGNIGVAPATASNSYVYVGDLAAGNAMIFVQADGGDLYIASGPINGFPFVPTNAGVPSIAGTPGGSVQATMGTPGTAVRLLCTIPPQKFMLEPPRDVPPVGSGGQAVQPTGDNWIAFTLVNSALTGCWFRWWRSSLLSTGGQG